MLISFSSLEVFFDEKLNIEEISEKLTMSGIEVDSVTKCDFESLDDLIVVGEIANIFKHPNADKLQICEINIGKEESLQIVCGAKNISIGDFVPTALVGSKLPTGLKIKKSKIRDQESYGMLCSLQELGLPYQIDDGIFLLPNNYQIGESLNKFYELNDFILDLGITPNRGDCLSSYGISREICAVLKNKIKPAFDFDDNLFQNSSQIDIDVSIDSKNVRRYCLTKINNVKIGNSPFWLKNYLAKFGISSINNLVDITNYFMLVSGQPIHAFDLDLINSKKIIISDQTDSEFETLSNQQCQTNKSLSISDGIGPVALAGIIGGKRTSVSFETKDILLECASFNPESIRKSSKHLNISTESSFRFERDVPPNLTRINIINAANLIADFCGGEISNEIYDSNINIKNLDPIKINLSKISSVIGIDINKEKIYDIFNCLNIKLINETEEYSTLIPPDYRTDLKDEHDLIEEIARMMGLDSIPEIPPKIPLALKPNNNFLSYRNEKKLIRNILISHGYSEVVNFSFVSNENILNSNNSSLKILNPISSDLSVMRNNLLSSLIENASYNLNRGSEAINIFEIGKVFINKKENSENLFVSFLSSETRQDLLWDKTSTNYYDLKGIVEKILFSFNFNSTQISFSKINDNNLYHPGKSAKIEINNIEIGQIGEIHPQLLKSFNIKKSLLGCELNIENLPKDMNTTKSMKAFSNLPQVKRDFSIILKKNVPADSILKKILELNVPILKDVKIFDSFQSDKIGKDKVSISFSLIYETSEKTLEDSEVSNATDLIISKIKELYDFEVRST